MIASSQFLQQALDVIFLAGLQRNRYRLLLPVLVPFLEGRPARHLGNERLVCRIGIRAQVQRTQVIRGYPEGVLPGLRRADEAPDPNSEIISLVGRYAECVQ